MGHYVDACMVPLWTVVPIGTTNGAATQLKLGLFARFAMHQSNGGVSPARISIVKGRARRRKIEINGRTKDGTNDRHNLFNGLHQIAISGRAQENHLHIFQMSHSRGYCWHSRQSKQWPQR